MDQFFDYQLTGARWLETKRFAILGDQPRVGKTPQAILAADRAGAKQVAIVCPAVAVGVWEAAIPRWSFGLWDYTIQSYDNAVRKGLPRRADTYIFDEAHRCMNIQSARTQALLGFKSPARGAERVWALSGSIAPNHAGNLYPWLRFAGLVDMPALAFLQKFTNCFMTEYGPKVMGNKQSALPELRALLAPVFLRRTRREVFPEQSLPVWDDIFLASNVDQKRMNVDVLLNIGDSLPREDEHLATTRRLVGEAKAGPLADHIAKQLSSGSAGGKVAVYGWHESVLDVLCGRLAPFGVVRIDGATSSAKRTARVAAFRDDTATRVAVGQIVAAGEAVDMSHCDWLCFAELSWSEGQNAQVAARLGGPGQRGTPRISTSTLRGSIDEAVNTVLARRTRALEEIYGEAA